MSNGCYETGGCKPVTDVIKDEIIGNQALHDKILSIGNKVSNCVTSKTFVIIAVTVFLSIIGVTIYFSDLRVQAKEFPLTKQKVENIDKNQVEIKKDIQHHKEQIDKLVKLAEVQQKNKEEQIKIFEEQTKIFEEVRDKLNKLSEK